MKKNMNSICMMLMLLCAVTPCSSQQLYKGQIDVTPHNFKVKGDSVYLNVDLNMRALTIDADRSLVLTPVLVSQNNEMELPSIQLNGKRRHAVYLRETVLDNTKNGDASLYVVARLDQLDENTIKYDHAFKLENWMLDARLDLKESLCACAGKKQEVATEKLIENITVETKPVYEMNLQTAYIKPQYEELKIRSEEHHAYLDFPVAKTLILPEFGNNPQELARLVSTIEEIEHDKNVKVTDVEIIGYASPEGSLKQNSILSKERAESLKSFLISKTNFPPQIYRVKEGGEDWGGLIKLVEASSLSDKEAILSILKFSTDDSRKQKIRTYNSGITYKEMLSNLFPKLRRVVSVVRFTVRGFNADEATEIIKKRPQLLSLEEMFMVANKYKEGTDSFVDVFEVAVRLFPDNEIANLNAGAAALNVKDLVRAEKYLNNANKTAPEYLNNQALLFLQQENYVKAEDTFKQAIALGSKEAKHNLNELKKKQENENL